MPTQLANWSAILFFSKLETRNYLLFLRILKRIRKCVAHSSSAQRVARVIRRTVIIRAIIRAIICRTGTPSFISMLVKLRGFFHSSKFWPTYRVLIILSAPCRSGKEWPLEEDGVGDRGGDIYFVCTRQLPVHCTMLLFSTKVYVGTLRKKVQHAFAVVQGHRWV